MSYPRFRRARDFKFQRRTSGDITVSGPAYTAIDTGLDLMLTAQVGDVIEVSLSGHWAANSSQNGIIDAATLITGNPVTYFSTGTASSGNGVGAWYGTYTNTPIGVGGPVMITLGAGDISGGIVTIRLYAHTDSTNRNILASASNPLFVSAKNLGPQDPN